VDSAHRATVREDLPTMNLTAAVDGVEIKFTVADDGVDAALSAFGLGPAGATRQTVSFFDVLEAPAPVAPRLLRAGVVLRLREKADGSGKTTLKLRPAEEDRLTGDWAAGADRVVYDYKVEYDWARTPVLAASVDRDVDAEEIGTATRPGGSLCDLFLEVSARVDDVDDAAQARADLLAELTGRSITPDPATESKTEIMLSRFLGATSSAIPPC
jgi:hypothetical protein